MATRKMTLTIDEATAVRLDDVASALHKPKSAVVREAILDLAHPVGRLTEAARLRLPGVFDEAVAAIPVRPAHEVDAELAELRQARRMGGRDRGHVIVVEPSALIDSLAGARRAAARMHAFI